jgi:hypothetical protein
VLEAQAELGRLLTNPPAREQLRDPDREPAHLPDPVRPITPR